MAARVVIAGGGVAALEAALALRGLVEERVTIELVGPEPHFFYRPLSVAEPFGLGDTQRFELGALAAGAGATFTLGALEGVDAAGHVAKTSVGEIEYDVLLVAVGAVPTVAVPGALLFRGPADADKFRGVLEAVAAGAARRVAFVVPPGAVWSLPIYELALMSATHLGEHLVQGAELVLVTVEDEPLQVFGRAGSDAVRHLLAERGIDLVAGTRAVDVVEGELRLVPEGRLEADHVVALPRLRGARLDGVPQTLDGFVPVDAHCRVRGLGDVYAAGDITTFPIKQGGIATQMADAAAQMIASRLGADLRPEPFRPVLRGLLLTGREPRYLRHEEDGDEGDAATTEPLWWPPAKIVGRHLAPFLAGLAGVESAAEAELEPGAISIEVELADAALEKLSKRLEPDGAEGETVGEVMTTELLVVSPEQPLAEVAEHMRVRDVGAAVVAHEKRLIGILTSRDLLRALAAGTDPQVARTGEWMTAEPVAVPASTFVESALSLMSEHGIHRLPVVEDGRPVGMLGFRQAAQSARGRGIGLGF
ncbi:MAG TPA: CBS domain-containing protein [Gaiellaceae bacterium]|nr:CBS domain-containing protein [Gaiellaceae bacterium]